MAFTGAKDEGFKITTSGSSCWKLVLLALSYCGNISEDSDISMYGMRIQTLDTHCIQCLDSCKTFVSINCAGNRSTAGTLSARKEYALVMNMVREFKVAVYEQASSGEIL